MQALKKRRQMMLQKMRNDRSNKNGNFRGNRRNVTVARDVKPGQHTVRCGGKRQNGWNKNKYNTRRGNNDRSGRYRNNQGSRRQPKRD